MARGESARVRLTGLVRGWRPDGNPLRRTVDRVEAVILVVLCLGFLVCAPLSAVTTGRWAEAAGLRAERAQAGWRQVRALTAHRAPQVSPRPMSPVDVQEPARWMAPNGVRRTGDIYVPATSAGDTVLIWVNHAGRITGAPVRPVDVADQIALAAVAACLVCAGATVAAAAGVHLMANRRRFAAWDAGWSVTGPQWTGRR